MTCDDSRVELPGSALLASGEVHVWCLYPGREAGTVEQLYAILDRNEQQRADRFHFRRDAECYIATRAHLRLILANVLGIDGAAVRFCYETNGKPRIAGEGGPWFNVSHSGGIALIAVALDRRVGVDIEQIRPMPDHETAMYFSITEISALQGLALPLRQAAFFRCWTRKEAYLKARGDGLGFGLQRFSVTLTPDMPARLLHVEGHPEEPYLWEIRDLLVDPAYSASLVTESPIHNVCIHSITQ